MDEFEKFGLWYLPDQPEFAVGGRLRFQRGSGITLELLGHESSGGPLFSSASHAIIVGATEDGKETSLIDCREFNRGFRGPLSHRQLLVSVAYSGILFESPDEIRFSAIALGYDILPAWARTDGRFAVQPETAGGRRVFTYEADKGLQAHTPSGRLSLAFGTSESHNPDEFSLRRVPRFGGFPAATETLDELLSHFHFPLQTLLTLSARQPVELTDISVRFEFSDGDGTDTRQTWLNVWLDTVVTGGGTARPNLRFRVADLANEFEATMSGWFQLADRIRPLLDIWHAAHAAKRSYVEQKFQYAVAAAEGLHSLAVPRVSRSIDELDDPIAREVLESYAGKRRRWLLEKLSPGPLRKRLTALTEPSIFDDFFRDPGHRSSSIRAIVVNRNHLAHGTLIASREKLGGEALHWATELVLHLAEWQLLMQWGVTPEKASAWLRRDPEFGRAALRFKATVG